MPSQTNRKARLFPISREQLEILRRAARAERLQVATDGDESACIEMWRRGLLRVNGEPGYQLSRLGRAALEAQASASSQS